MASEISAETGNSLLNNKKSEITLEVMVYTGILLVSGTINTIGFKSQSHFYNFKHGFLQSFLMFLGLFLNLITFNVPLMFSPERRERHFRALSSEAVKEKKNVRVSGLLLGSPSCIDAVASSLQNFGLLLLPASINQLLCGGSIITVCVISKFMLGRDILRHHWLGNGLALIGLNLVGLSSLINDDATQRYSFEGEVLGIVLVLISLVLQGIQFNIEELIMIKNSVDPQRMVGVEGCYGMIWTFFWIVGLSFFKCSDQYMCDLGGYLEDPVTGFKQILDNPGLMFLCGLCVLSVMFFNISSMNLTKKVF